MPVFVRVRDKDTRHEFDIPESSPLLTRGLVERVKPRLYPPHHRPRAPKHHLNFPSHPAGDQPKSSGEGVATQKENTDG